MIFIPKLSTFSIVGYDPAAQEWGIAVQSKVLGVGAVVPWARAGIGAVATQALANTSYGPNGLDLMAQGATASEAVQELVKDDEMSAHRQIGLVDSQGQAATYTGEECLDWAGGLADTSFAAQGNILVSSATVEAMARTYTETQGDLSNRLVSALAAGQAAGGDRRGQQSAAILIVREGGGYAGFNDRYMDLRVDDDPQPIERLKALIDLHHLFFSPPADNEMVAIDGTLVRDIQRIVRASGHYDGPINGSYDTPTENALRTLVGIENFEERFDEEKRLISSRVLDALAEKYPS